MNDATLPLKKFSDIPVSIVTYDREYYTSFDNKVRLTIDRNLKTYLKEIIYSDPTLNFIESIQIL